MSSLNRIGMSPEGAIPNVGKAEKRSRIGDPKKRLADLSEHGYDLRSKRLQVVPAAIKDEDRAFKPSSEFTSLTRYLPQREQILQQQELRGDQQDHLCKQLQKGNWEAIFAGYRQAPDELAKDGLASFYKGNINADQFTTLLLAWSLLVEFPEKTIHINPLFHQDGSVNQAAKNSIRATLKNTKEEFPAFLSEETQVDAFFERMRGQPESEKFFFSIDAEPYQWGIPVVEQMAELAQGSRTITREIAESVSVNVFHQFQRAGRTYRMVPSLSMMQQFLNTYAREGDAVKITPVIGLSSIQDIENNIISNTRDMGLAFPGVDLPKEADELLAPYTVDFVGHDFYHSIVASDVPRRLRPAFKEYAEAIQLAKADFNENEMAYKFLDFLYERIIDMEHPTFRQNVQGVVLNEENPTEAQLLVTALVFQQQNVLNRFLLKERDEAGNSLDSLAVAAQERLPEFVYRVAQANVIEKITERLNPSEFCHKFHISQEDLEPMLAVKRQVITSMQEALEEIERAGPENAPPSFFEEIEFAGTRMTSLESQKMLLASGEKMDLCGFLMRSFETV
ncbi:MAG: hypothetical protein FJZ63_02300 [Chlamydiae bacterium]|nr:hypothetical protein [Chlamydiota bacterium]